MNWFIGLVFGITANLAFADKAVFCDLDFQMFDKVSLDNYLSSDNTKKLVIHLSATVDGNLYGYSSEVPFHTSSAREKLSGYSIQATATKDQRSSLKVQFQVLKDNKAIAAVIANKDVDSEDLTGFSFGYINPWAIKIPFNPSSLLIDRIVQHGEIHSVTAKDCYIDDLF